MNKKNRILFLYTELAGYFMACIRTLSIEKDVEIYIVKYPQNPEAPFIFDEVSNVHILERNDFSQNKLISKAKEIAPDIIFCSGWVDSSYLSVCKHFFNKIPTVFTFDNHWYGSFKQYLASLYSPFYLLKRFSHAWIPGIPQYPYAIKLGFKQQEIMTGSYSGDFELFNNAYLNTITKKEYNVPKVFLYVGRYVKHKGITDLWLNFIDMDAENPSDWELWCAGAGNLEKKFPKHKKIKNLGFIQPAQLVDLIDKTGVFVLPSHIEPWGVAIHEFAAAGMPLICSNKVGAASQFLEDGKNGYCYHLQDKNTLKHAMRKIINLTNEELLIMGKHSNQLAKKITPDTWVATIKSLVNGR